MKLELTVAEATAVYKAMAQKVAILGLEKSVAIAIEKNRLERIMQRIEEEMLNE